jgi:hypothetical protein
MGSAATNEAQSLASKKTSSEVIAAKKKVFIKKSYPQDLQQKLTNLN